MGGRPRKPTNLLQLTGAFKKNPARGRSREYEPKPEGELGGPPECWDAETSEGERLIAIWEELVANVPEGVLTSADRFHVELTCRLMRRVRSGFGKTSDFGQLNVLLGKMGLNPSDRSRVATVEAEKPGALDVFARKRKSG